MRPHHGGCRPGQRSSLGNSSVGPAWAPGVARQLEPPPPALTHALASQALWGTRFWPCSFARAGIMPRSSSALNPTVGALMGRQDPEPHTTHSASKKRADGQVTEALGGGGGGAGAQSKTKSGSKTSLPLRQQAGARGLIWGPPSSPHHARGEDTVRASPPTIREAQREARKTGPPPGQGQAVRLESGVQALGAAPGEPGAKEPPTAERCAERSRSLQWTALTGRPLCARLGGG